MGSQVFFFNLYQWKLKAKLPETHADLLFQFGIFYYYHHHAKLFQKGALESIKIDKENLRKIIKI